MLGALQRVGDLEGDVQKEKLDGTSCTFQRVQWQTVEFESGISAESKIVLVVEARKSDVPSRFIRCRVATASLAATIFRASSFQFSRLPRVCTKR